MAVSPVFIDSFTHLAVSVAGGNLLQKWTQRIGNGSNNSGGRRAGQYALSGNVADGWEKSLPPYRTWIFGFAYYLDTMPNGGVMLGLLDGSSYQVELRIGADGRPYVTRNGTWIASANSLLPNLDTWYHFEFAVDILDASGRAYLNVNGVNVMNFTGDTKNTGNAYVTGFRWLAAGQSNRLTDLVVRAGTGFTLPDDMWGDCGVGYKPMSIAGTYQDFDSSLGAGQNPEAIDETQANNDTDYNHTTVVGERDSFTGTALSGVSEIKAVQVVAQARKDDVGGSHQIVLFTHNADGDSDGTAQAVTDNYAIYRQCWQTNPRTSAAWQASEIGGASAQEFGYKMES